MDERGNLHIIEFDPFHAEDQLLHGQIRAIRNHRALPRDLRVHQGTPDLVAALDNHADGKRPIHVDEVFDGVIADGRGRAAFAQRLLTAREAA